MSVLVQITAQRGIGDKPLTKPIVMQPPSLSIGTSLYMYIYVCVCHLEATA